jgi:hypothetical protein
MNVKIVILVILILVLTAGCQRSTPETSTLTPITIILTSTHYPTSTLTLVPSSTPGPLVHQPELISRKKLDCSSLGTFTKCIDDVLNIEFEYPTLWGEIEAELRTGGYTGYAYDYYYGGKTISETEPLVAGGRSMDFSEGRGGMSTDFAGYGKTGLQFKTNACASEWTDLFPVCQEVTTGIAWMIRFPNAKYICNSSPGFYTTPVFRIEVDLPNNPKINGFVFEAPLFSEQFDDEVKSELYPLLGLDSDMIPTKCGEINQQAFDSRLKTFIERITNKSTDSETLRNFDELTHLATSIVFR